jgi:hypothetical protein
MNELVNQLMRMMGGNAAGFQNVLASLGQALKHVNRRRGAMGLPEVVMPDIAALTKSSAMAAPEVVVNPAIKILPKPLLRQRFGVQKFAAKPKPFKPGWTGGWAGEREVEKPPKQPEAPQGPSEIIMVAQTLTGVHHTNMTAKGKYCDTGRWFSYTFLVIDTGARPGERGSAENPWMGLLGEGWRCYYPNSSVADYGHILSSASSGLWLHAWSEKSNYVSF